MSEQHAKRLQSLLASLPEKNAGILVTDEVNVGYLTGFTGDSSWLIASPDRTVLLSDGRYRTQLEEECPSLETHIRPTSEKIIEAAATLLAESVPSSSSVAIEGDVISVAQFRALDEATNSLTLEPTSGLVETLREVKDESEIDAIRSAVRTAEAGFAYLVNRMDRDSLEVTLANDLEHTLRQFGSSGFSFPAIIGVDDRAALPHYTPGRVRVGDASHVLVDWGAIGPGGYVSDITRTIVGPSPPKKLVEVYEAVREANEAGIAAVKPGATGPDVDAASRAVLEAHGLGEWFSHSLGHGIGLKVHEAPRLAPNSPSVLKPGMVVTIEPGVYLPGEIGVRIEDDVLVTEDGFEVLTSLPKTIDAFADALG